MIDLVALGSLAFIAGLVSFTAPCTLPLLPGYVSYVSGLDRVSDDGRPAVWAGAGLFVAGFTLTFTAMGATVSALGWFLASRGATLNVVAGVLIGVMGLVFIGVLRIPWFATRTPFRPVEDRPGPGRCATAGHRVCAGLAPVHWTGPGRDP